MTVLHRVKNVGMGTLRNCHWLVNDSFESPLEKCHWLVNDSFKSPIFSELMAICHWLQSMTQNLWTSVIDHSQWQKFMAKLAKKCHWPWSMTKKSVIDWMYTIYGKKRLKMQEFNMLTLTFQHGNEIRKTCYALNILEDCKTDRIIPWCTWRYPWSSRWWQRRSPPLVQRLCPDKKSQMPAYYPSVSNFRDLKLV